MKKGSVVMYILENIKLKATTLVGISLSASLMLTSVVAGDKMANKAIDGGVKYDVKKGKYTSYYVNDQKVKFNHGRAATPREIAAWNIDTMPNGTGMPEFDTKNGEVVLGEDGKPKKAEGTVEQGGELYDAQCVMCHGDFGSGGKGYPRLAGGSINSLKNQLMNPADENPNPDAPIRTIGSYWPYASTLFWYIQDAMPFPHPKSLSNSETYAITAYLLSINGIKIDGEELGDDYVLNREKFSKIKMPNAEGFYPDVDTKDPKQGPKNVQAFMSDPKNYGTGTRCMKNCVKGPVPVLKIKNELKDFNPTPSTKRDWFVPVVEGANPMKAAYEEKCSACHGNEAIGAPVVGNKDAWAKVTAKGLDAVYHNGINGINAMPPKGGLEMSDDDFKKIVDYMIEASK
jgi:cytochrome c